MKIVEALITEIREAVSTRDICGGNVALMHGKLTATALAILEDGRCVKFIALDDRTRGEDFLTPTLNLWNKYLKGQELHPSHIIEDLSNPEPPADTQNTQRSIEIEI